MLLFWPLPSLLPALAIAIVRLSPRGIEGQLLTRPSLSLSAVARRRLLEGVEGGEGGGANALVCEAHDG